MRKVLIFLTAMCLSLGILGQGIAQAQQLEYGKLYSVKDGMSADDVMRIVYHNKYSLFAQDYNLPKTTIVYVAKDGFTRTKEAIRQRIIKAGDAGMSYKDIVLVTYPTQTKGLAVLTWTYEDASRDQDTWLWIPALKKVRKVSASESDDAFMGSDFTVEEVSTRQFDDETYTLVGTKEFPGYTFEQTKEVLFKGAQCFVIEAVPKKPHWYYSKRIVWVDKKTGGNILDEYYDKNGKLFKTLFREWTIYKPETKNYPRQQRLECKDLRTGHRTVILNENEEYDVGLDENLFSEKRLERMKW
ncbi:MAG: outer membrane lipoprotein-sorting protein [Candidatus Omnitrophota bacterium]